MATLAPQRAERAELCDLLLRVGPDAPTLCEGWTTADLATHLLVRERKPLAGPGLVVGGAAAALTARIMARTKAAHPYEEIVARVRRGPPPWTAPFDAVINLTEYFVHHEDVRRGGGDSTPRPVEDRSVVEDALWRSLRKGSGLMTRPVKGVGLDLVSHDGDAIAARQGPTRASITGTPGEIVLFLSGRTAAAHIELGGHPDAVATVRGARFGV
jgi:uncharacterized protein (TIGR03085 family)